MTQTATTTDTTTATTVETEGPVAMYTVAWTGGHEEPSFWSTVDAGAAQAKFDEWAAGNSSEFRVDLLAMRITVNGVLTSVIDSTNMDEDEDA